MSDVADWLKPALANKDLSISAFCRLVGISREAFYQYITHRRFPSEKMYRKMCSVLSIEAPEGQKTREIGYPKGKLREVKPGEETTGSTG